MSEDADAPPQLSAATAAALADFLRSRDAAADASADGAACPVGEDWSKSQFWYTQETAEALADAVAGALKEKAVKDAPLPRVACVACPSFFHALRSRHGDTVDALLLEHDDRLAALGPYAFYDYNEPTVVPPEWRHGADAVIADPPYLAVECLKKTSTTVTELARTTNALVLLLTGAVMRHTARGALRVTPCVFRPEHRSKLGNEFMAATNWEGVASRLGGWDEEWREELDEAEGKEA